MTTRIATLSREQLTALYEQATGSGTPYGARRWAAQVLGVTERTLGRWLAGETSPTVPQVTKLEVRAALEQRMREARDEAEREELGTLRRTARGVLRKVGQALGVLDRVDEAAIAELERRGEDRAERLERDPFAFASEEAFRAYRRRRGLGTPSRWL